MEVYNHDNLNNHVNEYDTAEAEAELQWHRQRQLISELDSIRLDVTCIYLEAEIPTRIEPHSY